MLILANAADVNEVAGSDGVLYTANRLILPSLVKKYLDSAGFSILYFADIRLFCAFAAKYGAFMSTIIGRKSEIHELERHYQIDRLEFIAAWALKGDDEHTGAQIDLLIMRAHNVVNLCENTAVWYSDKS